jgi:hypothetical protein
MNTALEKGGLYQRLIGLMLLDTIWIIILHGVDPRAYPPGLHLFRSVGLEQIQEGFYFVESRVKP